MVLTIDMSNPPLTEKLKSYVESMIAAGHYAPGDRLPSVRDFAVRFELTPETARRALKELCERGILVFRHGSGTYVSTRATGATGGRSISMVIFDEEVSRSYCAYASQSIVAHAARDGWQLRVYPVAYPWRTMALKLPDETYRSDAIILLGSYDCFQLDAIRRSRPIVGLEMHRTLDGLLSAVTLDPYGAAELAAAHFRSLGVHHVKVIAARMPVHMIRAREFHACWTEFGTSEDIPGNLWSPGTPSAGRIAPDGPPDAATGYLFTSGSDHNYFALQYRQRTGCELAACPRVLSIDGKSLLIPGFRPANTIYIDWKAAGEAVYRECVRRVENPGAEARRIYLEPRLSLAPAGGD